MDPRAGPMVLRELVRWTTGFGWGSDGPRAWGTDGPQAIFGLLVLSPLVISTRDVLGPY